MSSNSKATVRMIAASFAAGATAMVLVGLVAPVAFKGGLEVTEAMAAQHESQRPVIELDVAAVNAQLAEAERSMDASRAETEAAISRLDRLSGR